MPFAMRRQLTSSENASCDNAFEQPNNSLQLTRLAPENAGVRCPWGCAIMDRVLPDPPGRSARGR